MFRNKWRLNLKRISIKVGKALNEVKDDEEVNKVLVEAKEQATKIEKSIKEGVEKFTKDLPKAEVVEVKRVEVEKILKRTADEVKSKLKGIHIFSDIAKLKVGANKKMKELKDKMSKAIVKAKDDAKADEAMKDLEEKAKKVADDLKINIAVQTAKGKDLIKPEVKLNIDVTKIPQKFEPKKAIEFLNNEEFMKKAGETIKTEIKVVIEKAKKQAKQKVKRSKAHVNAKKIKERLERQKKIIETQKAKVKKLRDERAAAKKNFTQVNTYKHVKVIWAAWKAKKEKSAAWLAQQKKRAAV